MIENGMVCGLAAIDARAQADSDSVAQAHRVLLDEFIDALMTDPQKKVWTPAYRRQQTSAADVVYQELSSSLGDAILTEALRIIGMCANGRACPELHLRAAAWIAGVAKVHAENHCDEDANAAMWGDA